MPAGPGVRVDTAVRPGERIPPDYDPMIAKVMTVGRDRRAALQSMRRALDEVVVTGIQTTLPFDRALVRDPSFADDSGAALSTDWVGERWDGPADRARVAEVASIVAASKVRGASASGARSQASLRKDTEASAWRRDGRRTLTNRWPR
jgi:acetyl/propionyl-CoA carboxylase alpha subunit